MERAGVGLTHDFFFRRLLRLKYEQEVRHLRTKTHVSVPLGALLMGVPDPLGVLEEGQVFVQIQKAADADVEPIVAENVLLYRNPLLHPGDVRVLSAVECPALAQYVNVVVFPARHKVTARSIPAECSGGDLDGDCFAVVWDPALVPPRDREIVPFDYEQHSKDAKAAMEKRFGGTMPAQTIPGFVSLGMCNSVLGKIARQSLAVTDQLEGGARHPLAIELAKAQSLAVDWPKNGVDPVVPPEVAEMLNESGYPDFMVRSLVFAKKKTCT